jgi:hypothetical protein
LWFWLLRVRVPSVTRRAVRAGKLQIPNFKLQITLCALPWLEIGIWRLGFPPEAVACALLKDGAMLNPAGLVSLNAKAADFWLRLLNDEALRDCDDLEKIVIGCEIIAALDAVDLLAAA